MQGWEGFDAKFLTNTGLNALVLKTRNLSFNEVFHLDVVVSKKKIALLKVFGFAKKFERNRPLGYIIVFEGTPIVHNYTFFAGLSWGDSTAIGRKEPKIIYTDQDVRMFRLGIGGTDYLFGYRHKRKEHDQIGSDGIVHNDMATSWKDGF